MSDSLVRCAPARCYSWLFRATRAALILLILVGASSLARGESWQYGAPVCTQQFSWIGGTPDSVAKQYTAALVSCDPPEYNEYFLGCDAAVVATGGVFAGRAASAQCYTARTLSGVEVALQYAVSKFCAVTKVMDPGSYACMCPSGTFESGSSCVAMCPTGTHPQAGRCWPNPPKDQGCVSEPCQQKANPVNAGNGVKLQSEPVYRGAGLSDLSLTLSYSAYPATNDLENAQIGPFGRNWFSRYTIRIKPQRQGTIGAVREDGRELEFRPPATGDEFTTDADTTDRLTRLTSGSALAGWRYYTSRGDESELYDAAGRLLSITTRSGRTTRFTYSNGQNGILYPEGDSNPATAGPEGFRSPACSIAHPILPGTRISAGLLLCASDHVGRQLSFEYIDPALNNYDTFSRVRRMVDPAGNQYLFQFDGPTGPVDANNLTAVVFPGVQTRTYHYNESAQINGGAGCSGGAPARPNALTGLTDENSSRFATWTYDCSNRVTSSRHALDADLYMFSYASGATDFITPLGAAQTLNVQRRLGVMKPDVELRPDASGTGTASSALGYDANGNVNSRTDWNGNRTNFIYDLSRNLETSRIEGLTAGGAATPQTRTISTQWDANFRLPSAMAEPLRITTNVYDADGTACGARGALCSKTIQATSDTNGSLAFDATPVGAPRTWIHTYNPNGSMLTVDGPRTTVSDVVAYSYYPNNDPDVGKRGNVASITNAAGHITSITSYNAHGQPLTIVDPNGLATNLAYDPRQRLTSRTVGTETTSYEYDGVGQLTKITLPDGSFLTYTYDDAHRMTGMQDNLGNRISYTLDALGNRTQEQVLDPSSALAQTRSRVFNNLNRLFQEIGAASQITQYTYDNQGNVTSVRDPLNKVTNNAYDPLNRLRQVTDPALGITQYAYNGLDALTQVTDARGLVTGYTVDGLGNLTLQQSPDTGNTGNVYDTAGNLLTQTDAKGQVTNYAYDALNRVTLITFHDGSKQAYTYDQGVNGLGRLSTISETDPGNQTMSLISYAYDPHGRVTSETRVLAGVPYTTAYSYDSAGRMDGITYPSGRIIAYAFDALGRVNQVTTTKPGDAPQVVVQNVTYHPFGGVTGYTFGNGQVYSRTVDQDGRVASYTLGGSAFAIAFDAASRITGITETGNPSNANIYGYDALDRLTSAVLPSTNYAYSYDAVGNRLTKTVGAASDSYAYDTASNRIASVTPASGPARSFTFDANGSTLADGLNTYAYDTRGRMVQATSSVGTTGYQVNALGQRVRKTNASGDTVFHYDTRGRLIAETDPGGTLKREIIYIGDIPVGAVQ